MTTAWLVAISGENTLLSYADRYRVYSKDNLDEALKWAKLNGYEDMFGMKINPEIGMVNMYSSDKKEITLMYIEILGK